MVGAEDADEWEVPAESIDSDLELKLHILGFKAVWCQSHVIFKTDCKICWSAAQSNCSMNSLALRIVETTFGSCPSELPTRYLPPGNLKLLHAGSNLAVS